MNRVLALGIACCSLASPALADEPPETTLAPEVRAGIKGRFGSSSGIDGAELAGLSYGLGAWLSPTRLYSLGLAWERGGLGSEHTGPSDNSLRVERSSDTLWLGGRAYPLRSDHLGLFVALRLGATWQHLDASGTRAGDGFGPGAVFSCSASDGPGFALGGGVGLTLDIDRQLAFVTEVEGSAHRLTSEVLDGCALGAGSVTAVGAHLGFAYRFDLGAAL